MKTWSKHGCDARQVRCIQRFCLWGESSRESRGGDLEFEETVGDACRRRESWDGLFEATSGEDEETCGLDGETALLLWHVSFSFLRQLCRAEDWAEKSSCPAEESWQAKTGLMAQNHDQVVSRHVGHVERGYIITIEAVHIDWYTATSADPLGNKTWTHIQQKRCLAVCVPWVLTDKKSAPGRGESWLIDEHVREPSFLVLISATVNCAKVVGARIVIWPFRGSIHLSEVPAEHVHLLGTQQHGTHQPQPHAHDGALSPLQPPEMLQPALLQRVSLCFR